MSKKILSALLAIIFTGIIQASAFFSAGPRTYDLVKTDCIQMTAAAMQDKKIIAEFAAELVFDFYLPFDSESIDVIYSAQTSVDLTVATEKNTFKLYLDANETSANLRFPVVERKGDRLIKLKFSNGATIHKFTFNKVKINGPDGQFELPDISANQEAISSAVLIDVKSPVIVVSGARRYIDSENRKTTPLFFNGSLCLPLHPLARALGYYYEYIPEKDYILMRFETTEYCFLAGEAYKQKGTNVKQPLDFKPEYKVVSPICLFAILRKK